MKTNNETIRQFKDLTDSQKQNIARQLIDREIYYCVSSLVYELMQKEEYQDDLLPLTYKPQYKVEYEVACEHCQYTEDKELYELETDDEANILDIIDNECPTCKSALAINIYSIDNFDDLEIFEHWLVSDWLANKLHEHNEVTGEFLGLIIWGRSTTGQSIAVDEIIQKIAFDAGFTPNN